MSTRLKKLYLNAGQMKAGTTYLYKILERDKSFFFCPEKEIHYLSQCYGSFQILSDHVRLRKAKEIIEIASKLNRPIGPFHNILKWTDRYLRDVNNDGWYEDMFIGHSDEQWCCDFSNLTCTIGVDGLRQVSGLADDVRVTYCIRDAVSRAISHAKFHLKFSGEESDLTKIGHQKLRQLLLLDNILPQSQSEQHIQALYQVFGAERLRIIRCESLWDEPRRVADQLCEFLNVPPIAGEIQRTPVNAGPASSMNEEVQSIFLEIFHKLRDRHSELLDRHRNIVIG